MTMVVDWMGRVAERKLWNIRNESFCFDKTLKLSDACTRTVIKVVLRRRHIERRNSAL